MTEIVTIHLNYFDDSISFRIIFILVISRALYVYKITAKKIILTLSNIVEGVQESFFPCSNSREYIGSLMQNNDVYHDMFFIKCEECGMTSSFTESLKKKLHYGQWQNQFSVCFNDVTLFQIYGIWHKFYHFSTS